jgi:hypothetical protein
MNPRLIFLIVISFATTLSGCLIADEIFLEPQKPKESLQTRAEKSVANYIRNQKGTTDYLSYGFNTVTIKKPVLINQLDSLNELVEKNPKDPTLKASRDSLQKFVHERNIERTALIKHFFTLKSDSAQQLNIFEIEYTLNDTLGVKSFNPEIALTLPASYKIYLDYYFYEHTLFIAPTYNEARQMSRTFYRYFKDHIETLQLSSRKSDFLKHTLEICKLIKVNGKFEQNRIVQSLFNIYMKEKRKDISDYHPLKYSDLYETKNDSDNSIVGYYFFHKFTGEYAEKVDTNVVLIELSPYYEIDQVFQLDQPFENYVN